MPYDGTMTGAKTRNGALVWQQFVSTRPGPDGASAGAVSYRVEQHLVFDHGYVEIRKYCWSKQVEEMAFVNEVLSVRSQLVSD
jgi:hypothetical protein